MLIDLIFYTLTIYEYYKQGLKCDYFKKMSNLSLNENN